jgi:hypothetical protein
LTLLAISPDSRSLQTVSRSCIGRNMDEFKRSETWMESSSISNSRELSLLGDSVWQASNYIGARFHGTKDDVTAEIAKVVSSELAATGQTTNQQQLDRLINLSFRDFTGLPECLKDSGHDSITPQDFDGLMEKLIRKHVSNHKLICIRPTSGGRPTRVEPRPRPPLPLRPPPNYTRPLPGD